MNGPRHIAVIDIGKTNAKLALVDRQALTELAVVAQPNTVLPGPPWPHFDTEGLWSFFLSSLKALAGAHRIDAIAVTTHGACAAWLDSAGNLAAPVLDYEWAGPESRALEYNALRPDFAETGSPRLAMGLNLGAQLDWQLHVDPDLRQRARTLLTWPQYWGHRLTGIAASDVTSLGCHTDLWNPRNGTPSSLVACLGLEGVLAPARRPDAVLGPVLPEIAALTGLDPATPVACGIHDSNASLLPHLKTQQGSFSVVSTGTWVVVMTMGGRPVELDERRDTLVNVNALGAPVVSARFMGGREYELVRKGRPSVRTDADVVATLKQQIMLFPAVVPESGPFAGAVSHWSHAAGEVSDGGQEVALSFYLALMTAECLALTGAAGRVIVEGPFGANPAFLQMLGAATGLPVFRSAARTGTSIGAALLFGAPDGMPDTTQAVVTDTALVTPMRCYAEAWRSKVAVLFARQSG